MFFLFFSTSLFLRCVRLGFHQFIELCNRRTRRQRFLATRSLLARLAALRSLVFAFLDCGRGTAALLFLAVHFGGTGVLGMFRLGVLAAFEFRISLRGHEELLSLGRRRIDQLVQILVQPLRVALRQVLIREDPLHDVLLVFLLDEATLDSQTLLCLVLAHVVADLFHPNSLMALFQVTSDF